MYRSSVALFLLPCLTLVRGTKSMFQSTGFIKTADGNQIFYKDWGNCTAQPVVFSHGWPLSSDSWGSQMLFLGQHGYRVIAHDRRGHGHSSQPWDGNDMDTYSDDLLALIKHLHLKNIMLVGHSTGGGEVTRFLGRHGTSRVTKAVLLGSITPSLGIPLTVWDDFRSRYKKNRGQVFLDFASGPFFGFDRAGAVTSQGLIQDWMQQAFRAGFVNLYDCIKAFSETDFTTDMKKIDIPVLILHGSDDEVVPIENTAHKGIKLLKKGTLKVYPGGDHGLPQTFSEQVNDDLLHFLTGS